jgi:UDP-N-acetyl-D-mannosaminuronic acid dehydrogenase
MNAECCFVGLGYIGLPTAAVLASSGVKVLGVDIQQSVVDTINQGRIHIVEPGLESLVNTVVTNGNLRASLTPAKANVFVIAVPTPFMDGKKPDISYVEAATRSIIPHLRPGNLVLLESTSPVGTTEVMARWIQEARPDLRVADGERTNANVYVAYCPERVLPGKVIHELVNNDRVVGGIDAESTHKGVAFYKQFVDGTCHSTNARTAEMCKLVENSFRDVNIAFANELSLICEKANINVWDLIRLANYHPRVNILQPGCGVGGHCIAVDPWFLVDAFSDAKLIHQARLVNDGKPLHIVRKIKDIAAEQPGLKVACLGLAFKPDIDDLRESPAVEIAELIAALGNVGEVLVVEPHVETLPKALHGAKLVNLNQALAEANVVVALVRHTQFVEAADKIASEALVLLDFVNLKSSQKGGYAAHVEPHRAVSGKKSQVASVPAPHHTPAASVD